MCDGQAGRHVKCSLPGNQRGLLAPDRPGKVKHRVANERLGRRCGKKPSRLASLPKLNSRRSNPQTCPHRRQLIVQNRKDRRLLLTWNQPHIFRNHRLGHPPVHRRCSFCWQSSDSHGPAIRQLPAFASSFSAAQRSASRHSPPAPTQTQ